MTRPRARWLPFVAAVAALAWAAWRVLEPLTEAKDAMGFHDWDSAAAYRYITVLALKRYHELPWWHPYLCGGFPAWGYGEGASNLVSPFLPAYLVLPFSVALRVEVFGTTALGLFGAYLLASRFTGSHALRALVAAVFALNGRWALQMASGHSWHLQFAWVPFALYFFDRACRRGELRMAAWSGAAIAATVYTGGIYPAPHAALLLVLYALATAVFARTARPLLALVIAGAVAAGLAAPKALPVMDVMQRFARKIDSTEAVGPRELFEMLANPNQSFHLAATAVPAYGWHEWGCYVGFAVVVAMGLALLFGRGPRQHVLKVVGLVFMVLGAGAFHPYAPWTLLHKAPVFASQHVPSRFMFLGVLLLVLAFVVLVEGSMVGRWLTRWALLDLAAVVAVAAIALDIAAVSVRATERVFYLAVPAVEPRAEFRQMQWPPYHYAPPDAWAGPSYPAMLANEGFVGCYNVPDKAEPRGAIPFDAPAYKGEAYVDGPGTARIVAWAPSSVEIAYEGAAPGAVVVLNQNWEPSWRARGGTLVDHRHAVGVRVDAPAGRVRVTYFPRALPLGAALFVATVFLAFVLPRPGFRRRARAWIAARMRPVAPAA